MKQDAAAEAVRAGVADGTSVRRLAQITGWSVGWVSELVQEFRTKAGLPAQHSRDELDALQECIDALESLEDAGRRGRCPPAAGLIATMTCCSRRAEEIAMKTSRRNPLPPRRYPARRPTSPCNHGTIGSWPTSYGVGGFGTHLVGSRNAHSDGRRDRTTKSR